MRQLDLIKGRVAEALVESIFRRAEYKMTRFGRESDLRGMLKPGKDDSFSPDFLAMKEQRDTPGMYQTHMIEVKYRADLRKYLTLQGEKEKNSNLAKAKEQWPNLCVVFVTDRPADGRCCFQALDLSLFQPGKPFETVELHQIERFQIFSHNVKQHEELARKIFPLLSEMNNSLR